MTTNKKTVVRAKGASRAKAATSAKRGQSGANARKKPKSAAGKGQNRPTNSRSAPKPAIKPQSNPDTSKRSKPTKSSLLLKLLSRTNGATLADLMAATGWQAHSVRGFLSGTVRKRLKLPLTAQVIDGERRYRITADNAPKEPS